ncbi:MAG: ArnT family glycosyltransferase [Chthoniobacterales bacterium]
MLQTPEDRTLNIEHPTSDDEAAHPWNRNLLIVFLVWAAIYLPGLGTLEIKGEEGRRILPAVKMLQTGNYVVPYVGSEPYFTKPPLVNWLVAGSFKLVGHRSEWAARLPSVLCVLAVALAFVSIGRTSLGAHGSVIGALVWLTNFGMIEKGRLIEIEAVYVSLFGLAMICWMSWWQPRSKWLTWTVPWVFLGLGLLAKGPVHLVFFYAAVLAVLYRAGELRRIWSAAHLAGIALMVGIFAAWAVPCLQLMRETDIPQIWTRQLSGRLAGEDFKLIGWLLNIPRGIAYFLPWVLLFPFAKWSLFSRDGRNGERALIWAIGLSFVGVSLLPGSLPRYTMPLLVPAAWLLAVLLARQQFSLPRVLTFQKPAALPFELRLPALIAAVVCLAIALYAFAAMPFLQKRQKVRNIAAQINSLVPPAEPLYAVDPDYQPFLFYVREPILYVDRVAQVPAAANYLLVQPGKLQSAVNSAQWQPRKAQPILRLTDYRQKEVIVLQIK